MVECIGLIGHQPTGFHIVTSPLQHPSSGQSTSLAEGVVAVYKKASDSLLLICLGAIGMILGVT